VPEQDVDLHADVRRPWASYRYAQSLAPPVTEVVRPAESAVTVSACVETRIGAAIAGACAYV
jgi:hypothetical protein